MQEGLDAISEVIYHVETYDVTTIRASTPMFLMTRKIKALGVKMVLSGEGSDEIFGGYLYFHKAPNKEEFHHELVRKIKALHLYDCQRANKSTSAWGLEARVPFLDKEFMEVAMAIDPAEKMIRKDQGRIEKWVMRRAFDDEENPYLPKVSILLKSIKSDCIPLKLVVFPTRCSIDGNHSSDERKVPRGACMFFNNDFKFGSCHSPFGPW